VPFQKCKTLPLSFSFFPLLPAQFRVKPSWQESAAAPPTSRPGSPVLRAAGPLYLFLTTTQHNSSAQSAQQPPPAHLLSHPRPQPPTGGAPVSSPSSRPSPSRTRVRAPGAFAPRTPSQAWPAHQGRAPGLFKAAAALSRAT
jgi:hypothetical protein